MTPQEATRASALLARLDWYEKELRRERARTERLGTLLRSALFELSQLQEERVGPVFFINEWLGRRRESLRV